MKIVLLSVRMEQKWILFLGLILAFLPALLARRNNGPAAKQEKLGCTNWSYGPCVLKNKEATCGFGKKLATAKDETCAVKQRQVHCKVPCEQESSGCKYKKQKSLKTRDMPCDPVTNQHEITLKLVRGDASCPPTKVIFKDCHRRQVRSAGNKEKRKLGDRKQKAKTTSTTLQTTTSSSLSVTTPKTSSECKYRKAKDSKPACDPATNTRTVAKHLKRKSPASCQPTKTFTEPCQPAKTKKDGHKNSGQKNLGPKNGKN